MAKETITRFLVFQSLPMQKKSRKHTANLRFNFILIKIQTIPRLKKNSRKLLKPTRY